MQCALRVVAVAVAAVSAFYLAVRGGAMYVAESAGLWSGGLPGLDLPAWVAYVAGYAVAWIALLLALAKVLGHLEAITLRLERLESKSEADQP